jgi:DnaK suppressor protein
MTRNPTTNTAKASAAKSSGPKPSGDASATPAKAASKASKHSPAKQSTTKAFATKARAGEPVDVTDDTRTDDSRTEDTKTEKASTVKKASTAAKSKPKPDKERAVFLAAQRELLNEERQTYLRSAESLKAQADSLALEHEPGDVQFDEEGGEGGTANVDREIDLHLSAQARATVVEIDRALDKLDDGTYGLCEHCGTPIPDARLQALPYAALCVACKSGGLSSRR